MTEVHENRVKELKSKQEKYKNKIEVVEFKMGQVQKQLKQQTQLANNGFMAAEDLLGQCNRHHEENEKKQKEIKALVVQLHKLNIGLGIQKMQGSQ